MADSNKILNSINPLKETLNTHTNNVVNTNNTSSPLEIGYRVVPRISVESINSNSIISKFNKDREFDPILHKQYIDNITKSTFYLTNNYYMNDLKTYIGQLDDNGMSKIQNRLIELYNNAHKELTNNNGEIGKNQFIIAINNLVNCLNDNISSIENSKINAAKVLKNNIQILNQEINQLHALNKRIASTQYPSDLLNKRDSLLSSISQYCEIDITYTKNEKVFIKEKTTGTVILSNDLYAQFNYCSHPQNNKQIESIIIDLYDDNKKLSRSTKYLNNSNYQDKYGNLSSFFYFDHEILNKYKEHLKNFSYIAANEINVIHNNASTFPPKNFFKGSNKINVNQQIDWETINEPINIFVVDKEGANSINSIGYITPVTIDLKNCLDKNNPKQLTVENIVNELNEKLNIAPAKPRAGIGTIDWIVDEKIKNEKLINNIQLNGLSNIENGQCTLNLDIQGNSLLDCNLKINAISVNNSSLDINIEAMNSINIEKGSNVYSKAFTINNLHDIENNIIKIDLEVIANNTVQKGSISFMLDANKNLMNKRISFSDNTNPIALEGDFINDNKIPGSIASVKLVKDNDNTSNHIEIETTNNDQYLVLQCGKLGELLGLNNIIKIEENNPYIKYKNLVHNSSDLNYHMIRKNTRQNGLIPAKAATAIINSDIINYSNNLKIGISKDNNIIKVIDYSLQLNQSNNSNYINQLVNTINNNNNVINAKIDSNNNILITANDAGDLGNNINISIYTDNNVLCYDQLLSGGKEKQNLLTTSYNLSSTNKQFLENIVELEKKNIKISSSESASLGELAMHVTKFFNDESQNIEINNQSHKKVLFYIKDTIEQKFGIDIMKEYHSIHDILLKMEVLYQCRKIIHNNKNEIMRMIS